MQKEQDNTPQPRFVLGQVVSTSGALQAMLNAEQDPADLLVRHVTGAWGDLDDEDKR